MSPDSFATGMDYLLERVVGIGMNGVSFGDRLGLCQRHMSARRTDGVTAAGT